MRDSTSRVGLAGTALMMLTLAVAGPAAAASPNGGCGAGLTRISIPHLLAWRPLFPPAYAAAVDQNGNEALCYQPLPLAMSPSSPEFGKLIVVDDRGPAR